MMGIIYILFCWLPTMNILQFLVSVLQCISEEMVRFLHDWYVSYKQRLGLWLIYVSQCIIW